MSFHQRRVAAVMCLAFVAAVSCFGQAFTANLTGVLSDASGGVIPNATVTLTNQGTNEKRAATTTAEGRYVFSQLLSGIYSLSA